MPAAAEPPPPKIHHDGHFAPNRLPRPRGNGLTIDSKVTGGNIPKEYIKAVEAGLREAAATGVLSGNPVVDLHIDILDGFFECRIRAVNNRLKRIKVNSQKIDGLNAVLQHDRLICPATT